MKLDNDLLGLVDLSLVGVFVFYLTEPLMMGPWIILMPFAVVAILGAAIFSKKPWVVAFSSGLLIAILQPHAIFPLVAISSFLALAVFAGSIIWLFVSSLKGWFVAAKSALGTIAARSPPRNGHRQKERIQAGVVEPFAYVAAGRQNNSRLALGHSRNCLCY